MKPKDWTGIKLHRLTFTKTSHKSKSGACMWEAYCDCGSTTYVQPNKVVKGRTKSCGCLREENRSFNSKNGVKYRKYQPHISSAKQVWRGGYRDCSFENFLTISQQNCHYCDSPPSRTYNVGDNQKRNYSDLRRKEGNFTYNGLDRLDSSKGHTSNNIVPCCTTCNLMKNTLGVEAFLTHVHKIARFCPLPSPFPLL